MNLRVKTAITATFLTAIALGPWAWVGVEEFKAARSERETAALRSELETTKEAIVAAKSRVEHDRPDRSKLSRWNIESPPDLATKMHTIEELAANAGLVVDDVKTPSKPQPDRHTMTFMGCGEPAQICTWLAALEQDSELLIPRQGTFSAVTERSEGTESAAARFEIQIETYHRKANR